MDKRNKTFKIILVLFLIALSIRIAYIFTLDNINVKSWDDEGWEIAKNVVEGKGYKMGYVTNNLVSFRPPLFPLFLIGIFIIFGQSLIITRFFIAILSSFICLVIFFLGRKMFNPKVGLIAMAISAVYPVFIYWGAYIGPETLSILLLALAVLFILKIKENIFLYSILSGICLGLLSLCRSVGYGLLFLFLIWLFISSKNKKQGLTIVCIILFIVSLIVSPWVIRNYKIHHSFILTSTEGGITFYSANNPEVFKKGGGDFYVPESSAREIMSLSEIESDKYFYKKGLSFIRANPWVYLRLIYERAIRLWRFYPHITGAGDSYKPIHQIIMFFTDTPIILLGFWGLILFYKKEKIWASFLALIFVYFSLVSMLIRSSIRYRAPLTPYLIILASYLIYTMYKRIKPFHE